MKKNNMDNYILTNLPVIHGTMLSIIVAFATAFALYAYATISNARYDLYRIIDDIKENSDVGYSVNFRDVDLDFEQESDDYYKMIARTLSDSSSIFSSLTFAGHTGERKEIVVDDSKDSIPGESVDNCFSEHIKEYGVRCVAESEIGQYAQKILMLLPKVLRSYPYQGPGKDKRSEKYQSWLDYLNKINELLKYTGINNERSINELVTEFQKIQIRNNINIFDKHLNESIQESKDRPESVTGSLSWLHFPRVGKKLPTLWS